MHAPRLPGWHAATSGLRMLLSPACAVCGLDAADPFCAGCLADFFPVARPRCARCAWPLPPGQSIALCGPCLVRPPRFDAALALGDYAPPLSGMVAALKFHGRRDLGRAFGVLLARRVQAQELDAVIAMPLAPGRLQSRGFNQAGEIARALGGALHRPVLAGALLRAGSTQPQQELRLAQRRRNVRDAFRVADQIRLGHVLLVDDVLTSGATLDAAAGALRRAGVARITCAVVARTP